MKFRNVLLGATLLALPAVAHAQPVSGLYIGGGAGVNWLMDQNQSASTDWFTLPAAWGGQVDGSGKVSGRWKAESRLGFAGVGSLGWGFGNGLRAEVEGNYRSNLIHGRGTAGSFTTDGTSYPLDGGGSIRGRAEQYAVMVNALYDFNNVAPWVVPYVGAGIGYGWEHFNGLHAGGGGSILPDGYGAGMGYRSNDTFGRLAFQGIAGAAFPIAQVPGLSLTAEYRFMGTTGSANLSVRGGGGGNLRGDGREGGGGPVTSARVDEAYNHSILLGARYEFNKAPAPVPAAPAAVAPAARSYLIFFDWDKSTLTDRARAIIKEAATASKSVQHTQLEVNGYADTSGSAQYNQGLSMRRAQTAAAELVRNGVPKQEIAIKAFGETVLLVPTGDGVREPQNRRVEIIIR